VNGNPKSNRKRASKDTTTGPITTKTSYPHGCNDAFQSGFKQYGNTYIQFLVIPIGILMGKLMTVSAKVSKELKKKADELEINISALVRRALEDEIKRKELQNVLENLKEEVKTTPELPEGTIVKIIRDMREGRTLVKRAP